MTLAIKSLDLFGLICDYPYFIGSLLCAFAVNDILMSVFKTDTAPHEMRGGR